MRGALALLGLLALALGVTSQASAFETEVRLDPFSFIEEDAPQGTAVYGFPEGARLKIVFGARSGGSFPVTIPEDGLDLGIARAPGMPPLQFRLAAPASGTMALSSGGVGTLSVRATILVGRVGTERTVLYDLNLSIDVVEAGSSASGFFQLYTEDETVRPSGEAAGSFYALIGGQIAALPPDF